MKNKDKSAPAPAQARKPQALSIEAGLAVGIGLKKADALYLTGRDPKNSGGRPPRDRAGDEALCRELVAALQSAPGDAQLRGKRGDLSIMACEDYLKEEFERMSQRICREAARRFCRQ
jgi:hypothetical protein